MALTDLFGQNAIVRWLFGDTSRVNLALTMTGAKLGERVLLVACRDTGLIVAIAARSGMSGHVVVLDHDDEALARALKAANAAGVLIEVERAPSTTLPFEAATFDLVVVGTTQGRARVEHPRETFGEIVRVLRRGGRAVVVQQAPRGGVVGSVQATVAESGVDDLRAIMTATGLRGVRLLAERDHLQFFEGARGQ